MTGTDAYPVLEESRRNGCARTAAEAEHAEAVDKGLASAYAPESPAAPRRLNLGAGSQPLPGYENLDRKTGQEVYPLALPDGVADEVRASHVLEHFSHREVPAVLAEWVRVLKPGGLLKVAVPDFELVARAYLEGKQVNVQGYVMGGHADADDRHGVIFDEEELRRAMRAAGLWGLHRWESEVQDCAALPVSLNLLGRKKRPLPKLNIAAAMSVPRLGFMDNFTCWQQALTPLGISVYRHGGAFWGQCLERTMAELLDGREFLLAIDYDSVYTAEAVEDLIRLAVEFPAADAVAPLQLMRGTGKPLFMRRDKDGRPETAIDFDVFKADLLRVHAAHFGLTLIRTAALRKVPHPWFLGVPGKDGTWGDDRTDDDTYFWQQWEKAGNSLYLAPHVVIAHAELMLQWPGRVTMQPLYQHPVEFWSAGGKAPEGVWR